MENHTEKENEVNTCLTQNIDESQKKLSKIKQRKKAIPQRSPEAPPPHCQEDLAPRCQREEGGCRVTVCHWWYLSGLSQRALLQVDLGLENVDFSDEQHGLSCCWDILIGGWRRPRREAGKNEK